MFATLKEKKILLPEQRQERRSDSTSKPENLEFFSLVLLFSTQHNSDGSI